MSRAVIAAVLLTGVGLTGCSGSPEAGDGGPDRTTTEFVQAWLEPQACPTGVAAASGLDLADGPVDGLVAAPSPTLLTCFYGGDLLEMMGGEYNDLAAFLMAGTGENVAGMSVTKEAAAAEGGSVRDLPEFGQDAFAFEDSEDGSSVCVIMSSEGEGADAALFNLTVVGPDTHSPAELCDAAAGIARMR